MATAGQAQFMIKNGSGNKPDVVIWAVLGSSVAELKAVIQRDYPGNPAPSEQTVGRAMPHILAPAASCGDQRLHIRKTGALC